MPTSFPPCFEILHIQSSEADRQILLEKLSLRSSSPGEGQEHAGQRLYSLLSSGGLCSVIAESEYKDIDFTASFARIYFRRHHETERRCIRLHFLKIDIELTDIESLLAGQPDSLATISEFYLGFLVLRPLGPARLGRCVLSAELLPIDAVGRPYITCAAEFSVNLLGNKITFFGVPWIQQDQVVSACASAAIWTVSEYMSHKLFPTFRRYTTAEITDLASQYPNNLGRAIPSSGLTIEQILSGLAKMGYEPVAKAPKGSDEARREIYYYVESGIPVVLSLWESGLEYGHAITVVGHTMDESRPCNLDQRFPGYPLCRTSDFVPEFLAQDDDRGPLVRVSLMDYATAEHDEELAALLPQERLKEYTYVAVVRREKCPPDIFYLFGLTIPFPPGVTLEGSAAEENAAYFLEGNKISFGADPVVLRTFLRRSNDVKLQWTRERGRPAVIGQLLRSHLFSRWVWVTEITSLQLLRSGGQVLGQIIQDCAGFSFEISSKDFLFWHLPDLVCYSLPTGEPIIQSISPYLPYPRYDFGRINNQMRRDHESIST